MDGNSQEREPSFSSVARQEQQGGSDWIQRDYDSKERREIINRLNEAEHSAREIENMISMARNYRPELKAKVSWSRFWLSIIGHIIFAVWVDSYYFDPYAWLLASAIALLIWPLTNLIWFFRNIIKNRRVKKYNTEAEKRGEQEKVRIIAQAGELLRMEEPKLFVLPKRFQYSKAFKGIRAITEQLNAINNNLRNLKVDVTVW